MSSLQALNTIQTWEVYPEQMLNVKQGQAPQDWEEHGKLGSATIQRRQEADYCTLLLHITEWTEL
jgi:hypothetical protein